MQRQKMWIGYVLVGVLALLATPWHVGAAGWELQVQTKDGLATLLVDEKFGVKMSLPSQEGMVMISRTDQQRLYQINTSQGVYAAMAWAELQKQRQVATSSMQDRLQHLPPQQRAVVEQQMQQMMQQMQNMSPEQKAYMEKVMQQYMGGQGAAPAVAQITYDKTGQKAAISGFQTWQVIKKRNGQSTLEFWVAAVSDWQRLGKAWRDALQVLDKDADRLPYTELGGLPIRTIDGGEVTEVRSIASRRFSAADFDPPAGAREVSMMEVMGSNKR